MRSNGPLPQVPILAHCQLKTGTYIPQMCRVGLQGMHMHGGIMKMLAHIPQRGEGSQQVGALSSGTPRMLHFRSTRSSQTIPFCYM